MDLLKQQKKHFKTPATAISAQTPDSSKRRMDPEQEVPSSPQGNEPSSPDLADLGFPASPTGTFTVAEDMLEEKGQMNNGDDKEPAEKSGLNSKTAGKVTPLSQEEWDDLFAAVLSKPPAEQPIQETDPAEGISADDFEALVVDAKQVVEGEKSGSSRKVENNGTHQQDHDGENFPDKTPAVSGQNTPECHTPQKTSKPKGRKKKKLHPKQLVYSDNAGDGSDSAHTDRNRKKKKMKSPEKLAQTSPAESIYDFTEEIRPPSSSTPTTVKPRKRGKKRKSKRESFLSREIEEQGTWVQCTADGCSKWRYLEDVTDPATVPDKWTCSMNTDEEYNSCEKAEVDWSQLEFVDTPYIEGSLVWARMSGYPWWPAMVEEDPDDESYYETDNKQKPIRYHVVFFGEKVSRAWIPERSVRPFTAQDDVDHLGPLVIDGKNYKKRVRAATLVARKATVLSIKKRLQTFGFGQRFQGHWGKQAVSSDEDDKEPPKKAQRKISPKEEAQTTSAADLSNSGSVEDLMEQAEKVLGNAESFLSSVQTKETRQEGDDSEEEFEYSPGKVMKISHKPPVTEKGGKKPKEPDSSSKRKGKKSNCDESDDTAGRKKKKATQSDKGTKKAESWPKGKERSHKAGGPKNVPAFKVKMKKTVAPQKEKGSSNDDKHISTSNVSDSKSKNEADQPAPTAKPKKPNFKPPRSKKTKPVSKAKTDSKGTDHSKAPFPFDSEVFTMEMESQEESFNKDSNPGTKCSPEMPKKTASKTDTDQKLPENDIDDMEIALGSFEKSSADVPDNCRSAPSSPLMDLPHLATAEHGMLSSQGIDLPEPDVAAALDSCVPSSPAMVFEDLEENRGDSNAPGSPLMDLNELDSDCCDESFFPVQGAEEHFSDDSQPFDMEE